MSIEALSPKSQFKIQDLIPDIEWWDSYFLPEGKKSFIGLGDVNEDSKNKENKEKELNFENFVISEDNFKKVNLI